jgi:hypothetical protein
MKTFFLIFPIFFCFVKFFGSASDFHLVPEGDGKVRECYQYELGHNETVGFLNWGDFGS